MLLLLMTCETGIQAGDPELLPPPSAGESDTVLNLTEEIHFITWTLGYLFELIHSSLFRENSGPRVICLTLLGYIW